MAVPSSFKLGGRSWRVFLKTQKQLDKLTTAAGLPCAYGLCAYDKARIYLSTEVSSDVLDISFEHELEHAIEFTRGESDHDETVIDGRAHMRHQFNKTARYK